MLVNCLTEDEVVTPFMHSEKVPQTGIYFFKIRSAGPLKNLIFIEEIRRLKVLNGNCYRVKMMLCGVVGASRKHALSLKVQISGSNKHLMISIQVASSEKSEIALLAMTTFYCHSDTFKQLQFGVSYYMFEIFISCKKITIMRNCSRCYKGVNCAYLFSFLNKVVL